MRIAYLLTQSLESPSGLGRYWPIAKEMAKRGHDVEIYALHPDIDSLEKSSREIDGVKIYYVAPMHVQKSGNIKSYYSPVRLAGITLKSTWALSRSAIQTNADILHVGKPHPMNSIAGLSGKSIKRKKIFLDCDDYEAASGHFESSWQKAGVEFFEKRMPHFCEIITTNTYFMRQNLISWGVPSDRIVYLPNGVERIRITLPPQDKIEELRAALGLHGKEIISYIGSMSLASHAVDLLLAAFKNIIPLRPNSILLLVGGGEDYQLLQDTVESMGLKNHVRFTGRVSPEKIAPYYKISHVSIDPVYDNDAARGRSPLKLFESWATGTPFITADVGDRGQLIGEPPAGLLTEPGDPNSLARAIDKVLSNGTLQDELINRGLERVKEYYWDRLAVKIESLYLSSLENTSEFDAKS